jgi:tetratricopeptide (TPR) repeat protein
VLAARVYAADGDMASAERTLRRAIEIEPAHNVAYGLLANVFVAQNRLDRALNEFDEMVKRNPKDVGAATMAGMIVEMQNDRKEAVRRYREIVDKRPDAAVAANNLAYIYAEEGTNLSAALSLAQGALVQLRDSPQVHDTIGWVLYKQGLHREAIKSLEQAVALGPSSPTVRYHLGLAYAATGNLPRARDAYQAALKLGPDAAVSERIREALARLGDQSQ